MIASHNSGMINLNQEVFIMSEKITISLQPNILAALDNLVKEWNETRSGAVAKLIDMANKAKLEEELAQGYVEWSDINREDTKNALSAQSEVVLRD